METVRNDVKEMLTDLGVKQTDLVRAINRQRIYHVTPSEVSGAIQGLITTPKGNRIVADCYSLLVREQAKREKEEA